MKLRSKSSKPIEPWAARIVAAIEGRKSSLRQFAADSGIPYQSLRAYAAGEKKPGLDALTAIVIAAGVSPAWLLTGEGEMYQHRATTKAVHVDGMLLSRAATELMLAWIRVKEQGINSDTAAMEALSLSDQQYRKLVAKEPSVTSGEIENRIQHVVEMTVYAATIYNLFVDIKKEKGLNHKIREQAYHLLTYTRVPQRAAGGSTTEGEGMPSGKHKHKSTCRKSGPITRPRQKSKG